MTDKWLILKASGGGGLGDLIKSLLVAAVYASLTKRCLIVDWCGSVYDTDTVDIFEQLFQLENLSTQKMLPDSDDVYPCTWKGRLNQSLHDVYIEDKWSSWQRSNVIERYSFDLSKLDYSYDVLVMWEFDQISKLLPFVAGVCSELEMYQYACNKHLRLSAIFQKKLNKELASFSESMIGVHVRASTEFSDNKGGQLELDRYFHAVDKIAKKGRATLFLATDNKSVQSAFKQRYKKLYSVDKWFSTPGEPLHLGGKCPDNVSNVINALLDIVLLSHCSFIVITPQSSFSQMAEIFSKSNNHNAKIVKPSKKVFLPKLKRALSFLK